MSFFGNILEKIGLRKSSAQANTPKPGSHGANPRASTPPTTPGSPRPQGSTTAAGTAGTTGAGKPSGSSSGTSGTAEPIATVDVVGHLAQLAANNRQKLNWKTSIVDLLKLLDIDSSLEARKQLADELGAPADLKDGSVEMNTWLHRTVLRKIAENGGNIPRELLD